jgi:hypothetical protein
LVVEGVSDQLLITAAAQRLAVDGRDTGLDLDLVGLIFAGGAQEVIPVAKFCAAEGIRCVAVLDDDTPGRRALERLLRFKRDRLDGATLADLVERPEVIDIESLVDADQYHVQVQEFYAGIDGHPAAKLQKKDLVPPKPDKRTGLSKTYEDTFAAKGEDWGSFAKTGVAERVADWIRDGSPEVVEPTLTQFETLLKGISARFARLA